MKTNKAWIGIDVSKDTLDVTLLKENEKNSFKQFDNVLSGFKKMIVWLKYATPETELHFCLEATGAYGNAVAEFLTELELKVSVVNPVLTHNAAKVYNIANRTDKSMSLVIAIFCKKEKPDTWRMAKPEVRKLSALARRREALVDHLTQEKNRLATPGLLKEIQKSIKSLIALLQKEIASIEKQMKETINQTPYLKEDNELLTSLIGIGNLTSQILLAELPAVSECKDATSYPAFAGLAPFEQSSGSSVFKPTRLSKTGSNLVRSHMYLPALSAIQHNPVIKAFYERLLSRGKSKMCGVGAVMRKLLILAYGVLKNREKFDANWVSRKREKEQVSELQSCASPI